VGQPNPTTTDAAIASCDLEPISWEYAPVKHHDTAVLLAWLVTVDLVSDWDGYFSHKSWSVVSHLSPE